MDRRTHIPPGIAGRLVPLAARQPQPGSAGDPYTHIVQQPSYMPMPAAPEFFPSNWMNLRGGGIVRFMVPDTNPVTVAAGSTNTTYVLTEANFDVFLLAGMALMARTTSTDIGEYGVTYLMDCRRQIVGQTYRIDNNWLAMTSVFGTGRYMHTYSMPIPVPRGGRLEIQLRNREAFPLNVEFLFLACCKEAGGVQP